MHRHSVIQQGALEPVEILKTVVAPDCARIKQHSPTNSGERGSSQDLLENLLALPCDTNLEFEGSEAKSQRSKNAKKHFEAQQHVNPDLEQGLRLQAAWRSLLPQTSDDIQYVSVWF